MMTNLFKNRIIIALGLIFLTSGLLVYSLSVFNLKKEALAGSEHNLSGWAWSGNIGWISFNNTSGGGSKNYGVNVADNGELSGWAWSENIGWITFDKDKLTGCPSSPCEAKLDRNTGAVSGWARACAGTEGGKCEPISIPSPTQEVTGGSCYSTSEIIWIDEGPELCSRGGLISGNCIQYIKTVYCQDNLGRVNEENYLNMPEYQCSLTDSRQPFGQIDDFCGANNWTKGPGCGSQGNPVSFSCKSPVLIGSGSGGSSNWINPRTDGWEGWIHLRNDKDNDGVVNNDSDSAGDYGVYIDKTTDACKWQGWAWGSDVVGWISFSGSNYGVVGKDDACLETNRPPSATSLNVGQPSNYCGLNAPTPVFGWTFSDNDPGDYQKAYQVQIATNTNFDHSSIAVDSGKVENSSSYSYAPTTGLQYNKTYYWRVKVWDSKDAESGWINGTSFTTPKAYPQVGFSSPPSVVEGQMVRFTNNSQCFNDDGSPTDNSNCSVNWSFDDDGNPNSSTEWDATTTFSGSGEDKNVTLSVTKDDRTCSLTKSIRVSKWPIWIEIPPSRL